MSGIVKTNVDVGKINIIKEWRNGKGETCLFICYIDTSFRDRHLTPNGERYSYCVGRGPREKVLQEWLATPYQTYSDNDRRYYND